MVRNQGYDVIVVGAGLAGLSAARTATRLGFSTLVVERLSGDAGGGLGCETAFVPGGSSVAHWQPRNWRGLSFAHADILIPEFLVLNRQPVRRFLSPSGLQFTTMVEDGEDPAALVDLAGLGQMLKAECRRTGANFLYRTEVTGLLRDGIGVTGVRTPVGDFDARAVICAEGVSRQLCDEAGLYPPPAQPVRNALVLAQRLSAPHVTQADLGQVVLFGSAHSDLPGYAVLDMGAPGHANLTVTLWPDELRCDTAESAWPILDAYLNDPRLREQLAESQPLGRASSYVRTGIRPERMVSDGFLAVGDCVTPCGHLGVLPSAYLGRKAALYVTEALDCWGASSEALLPYEQFVQEEILPGLLDEANTSLALLGLDDTTIDELCRVSNGLHLPVPFFGNGRSRNPRAEAWFLSDWELPDQARAPLMAVFGETRSSDSLWDAEAHSVSMSWGASIAF